MTPLWARMDETGIYPVELQSAAADGWLLLPAGTPAEAAVKMMVVDGVWVTRPEIAAPTVTHTADGWMVSYAAPDGSVCDVVDRDLGWLDRVEASAGFLAFVLADAGPYQIEVIPPRPWLGRLDNLVLA